MTASTIRALTVAQPWAWCITHAGKTVENRSWNTAYRGPILIHAARRYDSIGAEAAARRVGHPLPAGHGPWALRGVVIGRAELVDVHVCDGSCSPWAVPGLHHFTLAHIQPMELIPARGALGLWRVPAELLDHAEA